MRYIVNALCPPVMTCSGYKRVRYGDNAHEVNGRKRRNVHVDRRRKHHVI